MHGNLVSSGYEVLSAASVILSGASVGTGDLEYVLMGGVASATVVLGGPYGNGGHVVIEPGGTTISTILVSGSLAPDLPGSGDSETVMSGGTAIDTLVGYDTDQVVLGVASGTILISGGVQNVFGGAVAIGTVIDRGGSVLVSSSTSFGTSGVSGIITSAIISAGGVLDLESGKANVGNNGGEAGGSALDTAVAGEVLTGRRGAETMRLG